MGHRRDVPELPRRPDVTAEHVRAAFLPSDLARLADIKRQIDPNDTFRISPPIGPAR